MLRVPTLLAGLVLLSVSCKEDAPHMSPERMVPVIADLHVADAYSSLVKDSLHPNGEKNYDSLARWTAGIFARHKITRQEFSRSMDWYRDHPVELDSLYASVIVLLERDNK